MDASSNFTEHNDKKNARRESEDYFRLLAEHAQDIIYRYRLTPPIGFEYVNPAATAIVGYTPEEHYADPELGFKLVHPDDRHLLEAVRRGEVPSGQPLVFRWVHKDGHIVWTEQRNVIIYDDAGNPVAIEGIARDVTEQKRLEEELQVAHERLYALFQAAPLAIFWLDREGHIQSWNPAAERMFGWSAEEVIGRRPPFVPPDKWEEFESIRQQVLAGHVVTNMELHRQRRDGSPIDISVSVAPLRDRAGQIVGYMSIAADITERKRLEEEREKLRSQLLQAQKMESIGRLAGGVAHDFNNLLTVIKGNAALALEALPLDHPARHDIEGILRAGDRAAALTRQLLAFSRRQILEPRVFNLNDLIMDMDKLCRRLIGEDIELVTIPAPDLGSVKADPAQIEQALVNLAVNARDAMPDGGKLVIETANVTLDEAYVRVHAEVVPGDYVMLAITDTGVGMTKEVKAHLFEPFFTTKEPGKGTGLGLSTVYGIIKQHGGYIGVYSELGQGTTFKLYLPRVAERAERLPPRAEAERWPAGNETVLVVEDEPLVRELAGRILRDLGYTVLEASHGEEALRLAQEYPGEIHLLLTDVVMPLMSGRELAARMSVTRPQLKVLYASGYTDNSIVHRGVLDEGTVFIQKPFTAGELAHKVRRVLDE